MADFVDRVTLHAMGGNGGNGVASIKREKFKPLAGPDGGDGGNGGSVILEVSEQETTLLNYHRSPHRRADNGTPGMGDFRQGKTGADIILPVPEGTVVKSMSGELLADLTGAGARYVVAEGGRGGLGNAALASKARKAPGFALLGEPGEERDVILELKSVADVALVGFPSAGKSSLIAALSSARPKIADYPFTTLVPNLGVVSAGDTRYTVADVPGLIPGASQGRGLGLDFLRHIERCSVIVHVLDTAAFETDREPVEDLRIIEAELEAYQGDLTQVEGYVPIMERPRVIVLNKIDIPDGRDLAEITRPDLESFGCPTRASRNSPLLWPGSSRRNVRSVPPSRPPVPSSGRRPSGAAWRSRCARPVRMARKSSRCAATSRSVGCVRPTSRTTRPWATLRIA